MMELLLGDEIGMLCAQNVCIHFEDHDMALSTVGHFSNEITIKSLSLTNVIRRRNLLTTDEIM